MHLCDAVMRCAYAMRLCETLYDALCDAPMRCDYAMLLCEALYDALCDASIRWVNVHMGLPSPRDPEEDAVPPRGVDTIPEGAAVPPRGVDTVPEGALVPSPAGVIQSPKM